MGITHAILSLPAGKTPSGSGGKELETLLTVYKGLELMPNDDW